MLLQLTTPTWGQVVNRCKVPDGSSKTALHNQVSAWIAPSKRNTMLGQCFVATQLQILRDICKEAHNTFPGVPL